MNRLIKWSFHFLRWICPAYLIEEIEGDLIQRYDRDVSKLGARKAKQKMLWNIIRFCRPGIVLRNKFSIGLNALAMFQNYLSTALRIFSRQKVYSLINVLGLSVGLAASFLIFFYIKDELSYDQFIDEAEKVYRVGITEKFQGNEINYTETASPLSDAMRREIPEVISATRIARYTNQLVRYKEKSFIEKKFLLADSNFFEIFNYPLVEGNSKECLRGPNKIVLTESAAKKYLDYAGKGDTSPLGKLIDFGNGTDAIEVTGIIQDPPHNTHMKFGMILSLDSWDPVARDDCWACYGVHTYFKVNNASSLPAVEKKLHSFVEKNVFPRIERDLHVSVQQMKTRGDRVKFFIQPITSIHLQSHFDGEFEPNGDLRYVKLFGAIALFIILIACVNFMNLSTARAAGRAKEVGVRKTLGAFKVWLVQQFMLESFLYVFLSTLIAVMVGLIALRPFNFLTGKNLNFTAFYSTSFWLGVTALALVVGIIAGSYPAFFLSSFKPIEVLKGKVRVGKSFIRNGLVVFQFAISVALIISTLIIYKQLKFIQNLDMGFNKENIIRISQIPSLGKNSDAFKAALLQHSEFQSASYSLQLLPYISNDFFAKPEGTDHLYSCFHTSVDPDQLKTMGYQMKGGRFFSKDFPTDSSSVVINETCAKLLGYEDFEEKFISSGGKRKWKVIGIVKDFNFESARIKIKPLIFFLNKSHVVMALRITKGNVSQKIKLAESIWKQFVTDSPFQYSFIDDDIDSMFKEEQQMGKIFWAFTAMAIFIGCLGLFGLITFVAGQRAKEIGIRKVLGATSAQITFLLSGNLVRLVLFSILFTIPITWYGMNQWLQSFAYKTNFDFMIVLLSCIACVLISIMTVGYKSYEAASRNPVESLKNE